jgi:hypothetical protein
MSLHLHLFKYFLGLLNLMTSYTTVDERVEGHIIRSDSMYFTAIPLVFHHLEDIKGAVQILNSCKAFDESCHYNSVHG